MRTKGFVRQVGALRRCAADFPHGLQRAPRSRGYAHEGIRSPDRRSAPMCRRHPVRASARAAGPTLAALRRDSFARSALCADVPPISRTGFSARRGADAGSSSTGFVRQIGALRRRAADVPYGLQRAPRGRRWQLFDGIRSPGRRFAPTCRRHPVRASARAAARAGSPYGIRTRVTGVRGQRPRPLDERATRAQGAGI